MKIGSINKYKDNNISSKGKVIVRGELSPQNKAFLDDVLNYKKENTSIIDIVKSKSYDVYVSQNCKGCLPLKSSYKKPVSTNGDLSFSNVEVWYAYFDKEKGLENNFNRFLSGIKLFETSKETSKGFNNDLEKAQLNLVG